MPALSIWHGPVPMDTGAPEPAIVRDGDTLWVAYRAFDPAFPGWGSPATDDYLERHPGEPLAVLRFDGVNYVSLGPPNDERLHEHRFWGHGLKYYAFHHLDAGSGRTTWIVTFHDETLEVMARAATASSLLFASTHLEAIESVRQQHARPTV